MEHTTGAQHLSREVSSVDSTRPLGLIIASAATFPRAAAEVAKAGYEPMRIPASYAPEHRCISKQDILQNAHAKYKAMFLTVTDNIRRYDSLVFH